MARARGQGQEQGLEVRGQEQGLEAQGQGQGLEAQGQGQGLEVRGQGQELDRGQGQGVSKLDNSWYFICHKNEK